MSRLTYTHDSIRFHVFVWKVVNRNVIGTNVQGSKTNRLSKNNPIEVPSDPASIDILAKYADAPKPMGERRSRK